jgi:NADPH2:quinone reductase
VRAVVLRAFGAPSGLQVEDVPDPMPGPRQVVVDVRYASITFVETQVRSGHPPNPAMLPTLPAVLGNGVGGSISAVGDGVEPILVGRTVVTTTGGRGGYAERAVVDVEAMVDVPAGVDLPDAIALLADGRTAMSLTDLVTLGPGVTVLVEAAAGGVGSLLVQLARRAGAVVVAVAGGARKVAVAADLGADYAVDYSQPTWTASVRDAVGAVDVVFDGVGGDIGRAAFELLRERGTFVPYGMASGSFTSMPDDDLARRHITVARSGPFDLGAMQALTRRALDAAARGDLRPVIGQTFPLERAADAHAAIEERATVGKTLLVVS